MKHKSQQGRWSLHHLGNQLLLFDLSTFWFEKGQSNLINQNITFQKKLVVSDHLNKGDMLKYYVDHDTIS
jgi:hypothetical protein